MTQPSFDGPDKNALTLFLNSVVGQKVVARIYQQYAAAKIIVAPGNDASLALALQHSYNSGALSVINFLRALALPEAANPPPLVEWGNLIQIPDERPNPKSSPSAKRS